FASLYPHANPLVSCRAMCYAHARARLLPPLLRLTLRAQALDLLSRMLVFDPARRITVEEALAHPYMASLHNPDDEPTADALFSFEFEKETLDKERIQELIFQCDPRRRRRRRRRRPRCCRSAMPRLALYTQGDAGLPPGGARGV
ncbi:MAG: hypothetical protein ACK4YT_13710, partial [Sphingomonas sp.]